MVLLLNFGNPIQFNFYSSYGALWFRRPKETLLRTNNSHAQIQQQSIIGLLLRASYTYIYIYIYLSLSLSHGLIGCRASGAGVRRCRGQRAAKCRSELLKFLKHPSLEFLNISPGPSKLYRRHWYVIVYSGLLKLYSTIWAYIL